MKNTADSNLSLQKELANRDKKIVELNYLLSEREREVAELAEALARMESSWSWRLSTPVRQLGRQGRRMKAVLCAVRQALAAQGGVGAAGRKAVRIWRREGLRGVQTRVSGVGRQIAGKARSHTEANALGGAVAGRARSYLQEVRDIDIGPYDIISLDVFDTALLRRFATPTDLFAYMEQHYALPDFQAKRIEAEAQARAAHPERKDVDLDLIYAQPLLDDLDPALEMEVELRFSVANPIIYDLYMRALVQKKKIWFVSDMYLKHEQVEALLHQAGYTDYEQLVVSSHDDLVKGDGSRFEVLKEQWGAQKALHFGDNRVADFEWPSRLGVDAIHYQEPADFYREDLCLATLYEGLMAAQSVGLSFVLGNYRRWKYGDKSSGWSLWRDIGFLFGGPLLLQFSRYLHERAQALQADQLCFLARDGQIMQQVYQALYEDEAINNVYVLASRRAMTFPLFSLEAEQCLKNPLLDIYVSPHETSTAAEVFERLGYPDYTELLEELQALGKGAPIHNDQAIRQVLAHHHDGLQARAQAELDGLWQHLEALGIMDDSQRSLLVDVGWVGTIQDSLNTLMTAAGHEKQFGGVYLGVLPQAEQAHHKHGLLFDAARPQAFTDWAPLRNFIELLTAAPVPGVVRFDAQTEAGAHFDEVPSVQEAQRLAISKEIQHGIMDFVRCSKELGLEQIPPLSQEDIATLFMLLQQQPSKELRRLLSHTKHARLPSNAFNHSIIDF